MNRHDAKAAKISEMKPQMNADKIKGNLATEPHGSTRKKTTVTLES